MRQRVDHARRRGVGVFLFLHARETEMKIIGQHQHGLRPFHSARPLVVQKLIDGVKRIKLNPRLCVKLRKRHRRMHFGNGLFCPRVAVAVNAADRPIVFVEERVIHAPGIHADGTGNFPYFLRPFQSV